jgi:hypothetical protein
MPFLFENRAINVLLPCAVSYIIIGISSGNCMFLINVTPEIHSWITDVRLRGAVVAVRRPDIPDSCSISPAVFSIRWHERRIVLIVPIVNVMGVDCAGKVEASSVDVEPCVSQGFMRRKREFNSSKLPQVL